MKKPEDRWYVVLPLLLFFIFVLVFAVVGLIAYISFIGTIL